MSPKLIPATAAERHLFLSEHLTRRDSFQFK